MTRVTFLVTGATGTQGGVLARQLLQRGHRVRALVRDTAAPASRALEHAGAELWRGDLEDPASLRAASTGCDGTYLVTVPMRGEEAEIRTAMNMIEATRAAKVPHLVLSSLMNADRELPVPHVGWKLRVEQELAASGLTYTIVAPAYFMENVLMAPDQLAGGKLFGLLPPEVPVMQVAVADLAALACVILEHPQRYSGRRIDVASEVVTGDQMALTLGEKLGFGKPLEHLVLPGVAQSDPIMGQSVTAMIAWLSTDGFDCDLAKLHREFSQVPWRTFERWTDEQDWGSLLDSSCGEQG